MWIVTYVQNLWPFSGFKVDDLTESDRLVKGLSIPESTKHFVYAVHEPKSQSVIYVLCVQNLSERSAMDVECLISEVKPDAVITQLGPMGDGNDPISDGGNVVGDEIQMPTSSFEVLKRCFVHKINREKYENLAGSMVLKEIFGVGFNSHFLIAKRAAEEAGSSFLLLDSPYVNCSGKENDSGNSFQPLNLSPTSLVPQKVNPVASMGWRVFSLTNDIQSQMAKSLSSFLINPNPVQETESPKLDYEPPQFARSVYPLLADLHNIFIDIPSMGRALAHAQSMLYNVNKGETVDNKLVSEVYTFRIAVEGLRVVLNNAGRLPLNKLGDGTHKFSELQIEDKSHALLAEALRSQTKKFKSIVAVVDASGLAGLRKNWNTIVPDEVKDLVEELVTEIGSDGLIPRNNDKKRLLTDKPVVAVGAGATAVLGASSLSKAVHTPSFIKLIMTQTQKAVSIVVGKSLGPSKIVLQGMTNTGVKSSVLKASASAEKIRAVAHSVIASAEKTSLSAMRTAFYEIMRSRKGSVGRIGILPLATFGCSIATCTGLLMYGDGIECAAESLPTAPLIANLGRGIQSLHEASEAVKHEERSRIQNSIESLLYRLKKR